MIYVNSVAFRNDMDRFVNDSRGKENAEFSLSETSSLLNYVYPRWNTVQKYYEEVHASGSNNGETLYTFFRGTVARAAMSNSLATVELLLESLGIMPKKLMLLVLLGIIRDMILCLMM